MIFILSILLFVIFLILGGFHFYWMFGGTYGVSKVIPTKGVTQTNTQAIPPLATLVVALTLVSFGSIYLFKIDLISVPLPNSVLNFAYWFVPSIFILRSIGEFNYVGFFKKIKYTEFAKADSKYFSPLCLGIGVIGVIVQLLG